MEFTLEEKKNIADIWYRLIMKKKIPVRQVHDIISKEMLSETQLKDPKIEEQVKKYGALHVETKVQDDDVQALEHLVKLGYVKKTNEKIYRVYLNYTVHPYVPHVGPSGVLGILPNTNSAFTHFDFYEKEYALFFETAKEFENERKSGNHKHVTMFGFGVNFSYETDVYELKDDFFDAISLGVKSGKFTGSFTQPMIETRYKGKDKTEKKNLKLLTKFTEEQFLQSKEIRKEVKKLSWKKEFVGVIEGFDKRIYYIAKPAGAKKLKKQNSGSFRPPNFFGRGIFSYENVISRIFEDAIAEYLRDHEHYLTTTRYVPSYLKKEIDVFGERGSKKNKEIIVCECKFRLEKKSITKDELDHFVRKATEVKKLESKNNKTTTKFWFVTNIKKIEPDAKEFLKKTNIQFMVASLPKNWKKQADWNVIKISESYKR